MRKLLLVVFITMLFIACDSASKNEGTEVADDESPKVEEKVEQETKKQAIASSEIITEEEIESLKNLQANITEEVISAYLKIKDALVQTDGETAQATAENIHQTLENKEGEGVEKMRNDIAHIAKTSSVEHQREHFKNLSAYIYELAKVSEDQDQVLYKQFCPMAFDNIGAYWLSSSEEIRNPYFGDKMLKCGKVQETISKP